ncbi:hypothetical protein NC651_031109 [Populus alba x Populus x berolinensis]|nr:hypothetical protein NC651_031109 [Populus alba x Populus x berolinensis]
MSSERTDNQDPPDIVCNVRLKAPYNIVVNVCLSVFFSSFNKKEGKKILYSQISDEILSAATLEVLLSNFFCG